MTSKIDFKIEPWHTVNDILKGFGPCGGALAVVASEMNSWDRVHFLKDFLQACIKTYEDEYAVFFLEALARAAGTEFGPLLPEYLEQFYWQLPMGSDQAHPGPAFLKTRLWICVRLISEWGVKQTERSLYAFRRLIAMGWPERKDYRKRIDESDVEMMARGRTVSEEERRGIRDIIRTHMNSFASYDEKKAGPDAMFGPWLAQSNVPDDLRNVLTMARAKAGGPALAERDIRNGAILEGLPEVALEQIQNVVEPVRRMLAVCEEIRQQLVAKLQIGNPHWRPDRAPLGWKVAFPSINHIEITVGPTTEPGKVMLDIGDIIARSQKSTEKPTWNLSFIVEEFVFGNEDKVTVKQIWSMA